MCILNLHYNKTKIVHALNLGEDFHIDFNNFIVHSKEANCYMGSHMVLTE